MAKVKDLRENFKDLDIQVDGGLNEETVKIASENGANCIVAGSSIFGSADKKTTIHNMKTSVEESLNQ